MCKHSGPALPQTMPRWQISASHATHWAIHVSIGQGVHELLPRVAKALVLVHVMAALKHQLWDRDGLLGRMRPM